jgi:hypothetical protein
MIKYQLAVVFPGPIEAKICSAGVQSMAETLGPILLLTDESQIGKMRDVYPILIFRFEIILMLITTGKFGEAAMLLPMTLLLNSMRVDLFSCRTRKDLLH